MQASSSEMVMGIISTLTEYNRAVNATVGQLQKKVAELQEEINKLKGGKDAEKK